MQSVFSRDWVEFYQGIISFGGTKIGEVSMVNHEYLVHHFFALSSSSSPASLLTWHHCISNLGEAFIQQLHHPGFIKVTDWCHKDLEGCVACNKGRLAQKSFGRRKTFTAICCLETIHSHVCQQYQHSKERHMYVVTFIKDYGGYLAVYCMKKRIKYSNVSYTYQSTLSARPDKRN